MIWRLAQRMTAAAVGALFVAVPAAIAVPVPRVSVSPQTQQAEVGKQFTVTATITNVGDRATSPLTAHLEIVDPTRAGTVDAEDWVADLNTPVGALAPGASGTVRWRLRPIAGGRFAVYVVALPESAGRAPGEGVVASSAIPVDVREVRTLNAGGALPVSLAVPAALIVGLALVRMRRRRLGRLLRVSRFSSAR